MFGDATMVTAQQAAEDVGICSFFFLFLFPLSVHFIYSAIMYLYFMEYTEC